MMNCCYATFAALFLLFAAAACAPAVLNVQQTCVDVQRSSLAFNHITRTASVQARNGSKDVTNFSTNLVWIEAKDMCDPESLKQKSAPCIGKILDVLTSYSSALEKVSGFQSCAQFVSQVKPAVRKLHEDMSKCVNSVAGTIGVKDFVNEEMTGPINRWEEDLLCHYTLDRLFSFSILTARVFALGDPVHHAKGSAQKCM